MPRVFHKGKFACRLIAAALIFPCDKCGWPSSLLCAKPACSLRRENLTLFKAIHYIIYALKILRTREDQNEKGKESKS